MHTIYIHTENSLTDRLVRGFSTRKIVGSWTAGIRIVDSKESKFGYISHDKRRCMLDQVHALDTGRQQASQRYADILRRSSDCRIRTPIVISFDIYLVQLVATEVCDECKHALSEVRGCTY